MPAKPYGEIKLVMHSEGFYFDGKFNDDISEQAQQAYIEVAQVVAKYIGDTQCVREIRAEFAKINRKRKKAASA